MRYHASLITGDGAYHCPVGSIMAIFKQEEYLHSIPQIFEMHFYLEEAAPPSLHGNQSQPPTVVTSITCGPI